jgi:hypothetical protein
MLWRSYQVGIKNMEAPQSDLMAYVAYFLIQRHDARWIVVDDSTPPRLIAT